MSSTSGISAYPHYTLAGYPPSTTTSSSSAPTALEALDSNPVSLGALRQKGFSLTDAIRKRLQDLKKIVFKDPHSYSNPDEASIDRMNIDMQFDVANQKLLGDVALDITNHTNTEWLQLDTKDLTISDIQDAAGNRLEWTLGPKDPLLGQQLSIRIPRDQKNCSVRIQYSSSPNAEGLYWTTKDPNHFLLYSHSQPTYTRSWLPCQDTPSVRMTYAATLRTDPNLLAVMSSGNNPKEKTPDGVYRMNMDIPIPSYLMAFCVGNLVHRSTGERTGIYAHPDMIDKAFAEFSDLEDILKTAEELLGEYTWGRYDMLLLPINFPAGATENPMITFFSSAIVAKDRSLIYYLFHELAHSWSGNYTTAEGWEHLWLNEGMTTYFEYILAERIAGKDYADILAKIAHNELLEEIEESEGKDSELKMNLSGRNPRDSFSSIPYFKGCFFLRLLESHFGKETFIAFLQGYFNHFKHQSVTTEKFEIYLLTYLLDNFGEEDETFKKFEDLNIERWLYETGLPENCPKVVSERIAQVDEIRSQWLRTQNLSDLKEKTQSFTSHEWVYLIQNLKNSSNEQLAQLDEAFNFKNHPNLIIREEWMTTAVDSHYTASYPDVKAFVLQVNKPRIVKKFLSKLVKTPAGMKVAQEIYTEGKPDFYARSLAAAETIMEGIQ
ncbi:MAG: leukotriene A4 hydrolase C-terminal domain-containing protein [Rhabdochlamydiaceae bacterium]|nr:leukotriene A4 hydrolase C-terminal domain-containing protein [Rhabdochlamydiaceae bacterium]